MYAHVKNVVDKNVAGEYGHARLKTTVEKSTNTQSALS
jgi:hypothetical protein